MSKWYFLRHKNGGYVNKEGGEPCCLCSETLITTDIDDLPNYLTAEPYDEMYAYIGDND